VIIPDVNLLVYAHDSTSRRHAAARRWWEGLMNGSGSVGLAWIALLGFVRIATHARVIDNPLDVGRACSRVRSWLVRPQTILIHPGDRHADILFDLLDAVGTAGNLTTDAHLAALAIEHQAELHSTDADMGRFPGLRWRNPLA
jgi:hypothetical protein